MLLLLLQRQQLDPMLLLAGVLLCCSVEAIFAKLCECSALNPDTDVEDEAGAQLFFDEAEVRS